MSTSSYFVSVLTFDTNWYLWYSFVTCYYSKENHIGSVMVRVLSSSAVDHGCKPPSSRTKNYKIGICCLSGKHTALRSKSKD